MADVVSISSVSEVPASLLVKAAQAYKRPSPGSASSASKNPATKKGKSKSAKASSSSTHKPAKARSALIIADKNVWIPSRSFGYFKGIYASEKAYIVYKPEKADKPICLVNAALPRGEAQTEVMEKFSEMASQASLTKADVVTFKKQLAKSLLASKG